MSASVQMTPAALARNVVNLEAFGLAHGVLEDSGAPSAETRSSSPTSAEGAWRFPERKFLVVFPSFPGAATASSLHQTTGSLRPSRPGRRSPSFPIEEFEKHQFDLVVLDLMLPKIPGERVCRTIRDTSDVPIIMLTAKGEIEDRIIGLELGADTAWGTASRIPPKRSVERPRSF